MEKGYSSAAAAMLSFINEMGPDQWSETEQILQGGIERGSAATTPEGIQDVLSLSSALMELQVLQRKWPEALESATQVTPALQASNDAPGALRHALAIVRFAAISAVAQDLPLTGPPWASLPPTGPLNPIDDPFTRGLLAVHDPPFGRRKSPSAATAEPNTANSSDSATTPPTPASPSVHPIDVSADITALSPSSKDANSGDIDTAGSLEISDGDAPADDSAAATSAPPSEGPDYYWRDAARINYALSSIQRAKLDMADTLLASVSRISQTDMDTSDGVPWAEGLIFPVLWRKRLAMEWHGAHAQAALASKAWDKAESSASAMLQAMEDCSLDFKWDMAVPLSLLGAAYSRSGRVVLAEGILREAAKRLQLSRERLTVSTPGVGACHPSLQARVAWQLAQLYTALPKRTAEAEGWAAVAMSHWPYGGGEKGIVDAWGELAALGGETARGKMVVSSFMLGRVLVGVKSAV